MRSLAVAVTRRDLAVLILVGLTSAVVWGAWGVYGWLTFTLGFAAFLFSRLVTLLRGGAPSAVAASDLKSLVSVSDLVNQFEAELICQTLERDGIPATYWGRANPWGGIPGGGVRVTRRVHVAVRKRDAARAVARLTEIASDALAPMPTTQGDALG